MNKIYAQSTASITELKHNPASIIAHAKEEPVAILNRNTPSAYLLSAEMYEALADYLDDIEVAEIVKERLSQDHERIEVNLGDI